MGFMQDCNLKYHHAKVYGDIVNMKRCQSNNVLDVLRASMCHMCACVYKDGCLCVYVNRYIDIVVIFYIKIHAAHISIEAFCTTKLARWLLHTAHVTFFFLMLTFEFYYLNGIYFHLSLFCSSMLDQYVMFFVIIIYSMLYDVEHEVMITQLYKYQFLTNIASNIIFYLLMSISARVLASLRRC